MIARWIRKWRINARRKALAKLRHGGAFMLFPFWSDEEFERAVYGDVLREFVE